MGNYRQIDRHLVGQSPRGGRSAAGATNNGACDTSSGNHNILFDAQGWTGCEGAGGSHLLVCLRVTVEEAAVGAREARDGIQLGLRKLETEEVEVGPLSAGVG